MLEKSATVSNLGPQFEHVDRLIFVFPGKYYDTLKHVATASFHKQQDSDDK
jgi:hypothetical protein